MSKVLISEQYLNDIANAIRLKNGEYGFYYPSEMADAIMRISCSEGVKFISMIDIKDKWKFNLISSVANTSYSSTAEAQVQYDDSAWNKISLPHDWSIGLSFDESSPGGWQGGFLNGGDAWYRKTLPDMPYLDGKRLILYFDGIYMESDVYINGVLRKSNRNWYNPFWLDITDYIDVTTDNVIAVFVRNRQPSTHWYSGSGIYRKAYLLVCEPASVAIKDVVITTPNLAEEVGGDVTTEAKINMVSSVSATLPLKVEIIRDNEVLSYEETSISVTVGNNQTVIDVLVNDPDLWDVGAGNLYTAKVTIGNGSSAISHSVSFGYRYFEFKAATGFWLNGNNIKLKGVSIHDTYGCLGAKTNKSAIDRELDALIEMGCNAIRTAHNAYSTEIMNLCAEKGILVYEEFFDCWNKYKIIYDFARYFDANYQEVIANTVRRDRNNPAVILWGAGNEIISQSGVSVNYYTAEQATTILQNIIDTIHDYDTSRPITMSDDTPSGNTSRACMALLDVIGVNYGSDNEYSDVMSRNPNKPIFASECTAAYMIRGDYTDELASNYDDIHATFGDSVSDALHRHMDNPKLAGMFPWCGIDYLGEGAPYREYPQRSCADGAMDTALFKKDAFYLYQSVWSDKPMIHIVPMHWDWLTGDTVPVWLYSNCASVDLWLNGTSLGSATMGSKYQYAYSVPFETGTLVANGYDSGGNLIAQDVLFSSRREPDKLCLKADKISVNRNSDDLVFVTCEIQDKNGVIVPMANNTVIFTATGGTVIGTDSGWVKDVEDMTGNTKKASFGKLLCVVKPDNVYGDLTITATSAYLKASEVTVRKTSSTIKKVEPVTVFVDASDPPIKDYSDDPVYQIGTRLYINDGANITVSQSGSQLIIGG